MNPLRLMVTLWPSFNHFPYFAEDDRLAGIRLNSAMIDHSILGNELAILKRTKVVPPLYFDIKGQQLRVEEFHPNPNYLDITLNHSISVQTPTVVLFKAGEDWARLAKVTEGGRRLIFDGGPKYMVKAGESLHIRHPSLKVTGPVFTESELKKIQTVREAGFTRWFLSYVENQRMVDEFRELVGRDAQVMLKIESKKGLEYVARDFRKESNLSLVAARGDLFVEVDKPHDIMAALKLIIQNDPEACAGSRMLLSMVNSPVPSCSDLADLAWMYDIGYRNMMLCDELCLKHESLDVAVSAFEAFKGVYDLPVNVPQRSFWQRLFD